MEAVSPEETSAGADQAGNGNWLKQDLSRKLTRTGLSFHVVFEAPANIDVETVNIHVTMTEPSTK